jgi:hypothetical protein
MNKFIIIILIIILLIIFLYKKNKDNNEYFTLQDTIDKISNCRETLELKTFNNIDTTKLTINGKKINDYLLDIAFPIGCFYIQYPDVSNNFFSKAFPLEQQPENLFGGKWELQWENDAIFFRTEGYLQNESRNTTGIQFDAMRRLTGITSWTQTNYNNRGGGSSGVFKLNDLKKIGTDQGTGNDNGLRNYFDLSHVAPISKQEIRVKNRIFRIWKRIN